ncbi:MAG TPA: hypothetical protein VH092_33725 [Urbifossiella sp.]|nr:hypothetical protein [Urbifossiella sp.]
MWRMHDGDRVLTEAEWAVFGIGLDPLRDAVEHDIAQQVDDTDTGVPAFDRLTPEQQLSLLAEVALALRDQAVPTPRHTAANEGAIAAVFSMLTVELETELLDAGAGTPEEDRTEVRRVLRALAAEYPGGRRKLPSPTRPAKQVWDDIVEDFETRVFWDYDFDMGDEFLDLPPDEARAQLRLAGIDPDYYLAAPDEPGERGLTAARRTLARLLGLPVPDEDGLYPTLLDRYSDLCVGPISPAEADPWGDHPWVEPVRQTGPGWDCDYPTWLAMFGGDVPAQPFKVAPATSGVEYDLPTGLSTEHSYGGWVVRDGSGSYWCGLTENGWADSPDEEMPALAFPTEADARAAFAKADRMYGERAVRHEGAMRRLGMADE